MASNSDSLSRTRSKHKHSINEKMDVETEDALEKSVEDIRSKMKEKRRKRIQADLSLSRSRLKYKNANLVLKATLCQNNRSLAKSLEVSRNEYRHAQNDLIELQRERHLLQSVVNRFQDQHTKQRNQIKGVHDTLRKVTSSLMETVGLLGEAMDMCVIPRHTKDRSLGLVFRTSSSLTSDDPSDSEPQHEGGSVPSEKSMKNLGAIPRRIPTNKAKSANQLPAENNLDTEDIDDLPDIDVPLMFMSDKIPLQGKERSRRDTRNISAGSQKLSRRTSSLLDAATIAAVAIEIEKSAESIRTVVKETADSVDRQASICIDEDQSVQDNMTLDELRSLEENHNRRTTRKRSGRPSLRKEAEASEHDEEMEEEDISCLSKEDGMQLDDGSQSKVGKRRSGRLSKKRITYVYPDDDEDNCEQDHYDEITENDKGMELAPEHEELEKTSSDRRRSSKRNGRLSRRRGTFVKEDDDLKTLDTDLQEIEILDDDDEEEEAVSSKVGNPSEQEDHSREAVVELHQKSDASRSDGVAAENKKRIKKTKKSKDKQVKEIINKDAGEAHESVETDLLVTQQHGLAADSLDDVSEPKLDTIPDKTERVKGDNSAENSDYRIVDMELTSAAIGHISVGEDADPKTKSHKNNVDGGIGRCKTSQNDSSSGDRDLNQKADVSAVPCKEKPTSRLPVLVKKSKTSKLKKSVHKAQSRKGTNKDSLKRTDEKDVQQASVFDLSIGDSFSHPTPSRLLTKPRTTAESKPHEDVEKDTKVCQATSGRRGSGDGPEKPSHTTDYINELEEPFADLESDAHLKERKIEGEEKQSKIKRKSRKSKSVVTPGIKEQKVRLSEKALLEELSNLDASYLNDVTNPERKSKIGASVPSRKSSLKDGVESLNDLMIRPHHRKTSKRKLSKRNFYFGETENEDSKRQSEVERKAQARASELNASALDTSSLDLGSLSPETKSPLQKTSSSSLNTTGDILEDLESILIEVDKPKKSKKIQRRTTILKTNGQSSRGDLNVTFVKDDMSDFEAVKKDKVSKSTLNADICTTKISKAKNQKQASRKTFVVEDVAKTFFSNFDDSGLQDKDGFVGEGDNVPSDITEAKPQTQLTIETQQPSRTDDAPTASDDKVDALNESQSKPQLDSQPDESLPHSKEDERKKNKESKKTNKRKAKTADDDDDDDILDGKPSKMAKGDAELVPEVPERRGRRSKAVSYKEPSLNSKLRQGDPNTFTVYKGVPGKASKKKEKERAPLSNITN